MTALVQTFHGQGFCACGCGQKTLISDRTNARLGLVKGEPKKFAIGHNRRHLSTKGYRKLGVAGVLAHRAVAARALGRPLPAKAEVHHVDENKANNANRNLVICQDSGYHHLLHARTRVVRAGGNPNTHKICARCGVLKLKSDFYRHAALFDGLTAYCRACQKAHVNSRHRSAAK